MDDKISVFLIKEYENINYWLSHAEAKNAANLAFAIASIAVFAQKNFDFLSVDVVIISLLSFSAIVSLLSFVPFIVDKISLGIKKQKEAGSNYIFFYDISSYNTGKDYLDDVQAAYFCDSEYSSDISEDRWNKTEEKSEKISSLLWQHYCDEIVYNSKVTCRKYFLFKIAAFVNLLAYTLLLVEMVYLAVAR